MSVENEINTFRYLGDGSTTAFPISFVFFDASDVRVFLDGVLQSSGYSIVGDSVVFDVAPSLNADVFGRRVIPLTQPIEYPQLDKFPSISHERSLDRLTFIAQQQQNDIDASLKLPEGVDASGFARLPAPQAGRSIKWNAGGDAFVNTNNDPDDVANISQAAANTAVNAANTATIEAGIAVAASASATAAAAVLPQNNYIATTDPTVNDDNTQGYSGGSKWINTVSGDRFTAITVATGAAVWQIETSVTIGDLGAASFLNTGTDSGEIPTNADLFGLIKMIGEPFPLWDHLTGASPPSNAGAAKFIKLTAGETGVGQYNEGLLTSENVTGSAPDVQATAVISVSGSPINGQTVRLINTEESFLRPRTTSGVYQQDEFKSHTHTDSTINRASGSGSYGNTAAGSDLRRATITGGATGGLETRPKNVSATYYMRVL